MEEFTYAGAIDCVLRAGGRPAPVSFQGTGMDLDHLEQVLKSPNVRLGYFTPSFHNPTGGLTDGVRRSRLAELIESHNLTTIDDLAVFDLDHSAAIPPPLAALAPEAPILSIGTLSKVFWAGLRVGWIRANEPVTSLLASYKVSRDLASSLPSQIAAAGLMTYYDATRNQRNESLRASVCALTSARAEHLSDWEWSPPQGGPYAWFRLPGIDAGAFTQYALRRGVAVVAGPLLSVNSFTATDRVRLPLYPEPAFLVEAVAELGRIWQEFKTRSGSRRVD